MHANDNLLEKYFTPETIAVIKEDIYASENILTPQDEGGVFIFPLPSVGQMPRTVQQEYTEWSND